MKNQVFIFLFMLFSVFSIGQQSIGTQYSTSISFLGGDRYNGRVLPSLHTLEVNYQRQNSKKTALKLGLGITGQLFYSDYVNSFNEDLSYSDWNRYGKITGLYCYFPTKYIYAEAGLNTKIKLDSWTSPTFGYSWSDSIDHNSGRAFLAEAIIGTGLQVNIWRFALHLGSFMEIPLNNREYVNLGIDAGLSFNF